MFFTLLLVSHAFVTEGMNAHGYAATELMMKSQHGTTVRWNLGLMMDEDAVFYGFFTSCSGMNNTWLNLA